MKNIIISFIAVLACLTACDRYEYTAYDDGWDNQQRVVFMSYEELVNDCARAVEFTDIFDRYQPIREDRDAALEMVSQYIYPYQLYYDRMRTQDGDQVRLNPGNGLYYSSFHHTFLCMYLYIQSEYEAVSTGDRSWSFKAVKATDDRSKFEEYSYSNTFNGRVDDDTVEVSGLSINFRKPDEKYSLKIYTPEGSVLKSPMMTKAQGHRFFPVEGTMVFEFKPESRPCTFEWDTEINISMILTVTFHGNTFTIEDTNGYSREFESKPFRHERNQY